MTDQQFRTLQETVMKLSQSVSTRLGELDARVATLEKGPSAKVEHHTVRAVLPKEKT